jgi:hypothetical protein
MPSSSAAFIIRRYCCPPSPSSPTAAILVRRCSHHCHSAVSAFSCRPFFSFPVLVRRPISHAVGFRSYRCLPLLLSSAAAVFHRHSNHHHSAVSTISHHPLSSFSIAVRRPILRVVIIRHRCHPLPLSSAIAVPPLLLLPPTLRC